MPCAGEASQRGRQQRASLPALTKSRRPRETRMVLALRCPSPTGCARHARCIGSATVPAGLPKRRHDACSHATGPRYAVLGPAREPCIVLLHASLVTGSTPVRVHSSSFGSFASSHGKPESQPGDTFCTHMSCLQEQQTDYLLLAVRHASGTSLLMCAARLEIRLAPGSAATDSCDAAVCSPVHWFAAARPALSGHCTRT